MKKITLIVAVASCFAAFSANAQVKEDFVPSTTVQSGKKFPAVNSERCVRVQVTAPDAQSVKLDIGSVKYDLTKGENGVWTGESAPQDEGFHYYHIIVDGATIPDPTALYYYGSGHWTSGVEVPAYDDDFYAVKNVPQGQVREMFYWSESCKSMLRCFVYTPEEYEYNLSKRYPVLYIQHGGGENEYGWASQGKVAQIMDNLIAEGKALPFIVVMACSDVPAPQAERPAGRPAGGFSMANFGAAYDKVLVDELIPTIDKTFRTIKDSGHRAMAGLSMGGMITKMVTLKHPDVFSNIGIFSGGTITVADADRTPGFRETNKVVFVGFGSRELENRVPGFGDGTDPKEETEDVKASGVNAHFYVSPGTAHEWLTWRRCLYQFAQLLFK